MDGELRDALLRLVRYKFAGYPNVALLADDIIHIVHIVYTVDIVYTIVV